MCTATPPTNRIIKSAIHLRSWIVFFKIVMRSHPCIKAKTHLLLRRCQQWLAVQALCQRFIYEKWQFCKQNSYKGQVWRSFYYYIMTACKRSVWYEQNGRRLVCVHLATHNHTILQAFLEDLCVVILLSWSMTVKLELLNTNEWNVVNNSVQPLKYESSFKVFMFQREETSISNEQCLWRETGKLCIKNTYKFSLLYSSHMLGAI